MIFTESILGEKSPYFWFNTHIDVFLFSKGGAFWFSGSSGEFLGDFGDGTPKKLSITFRRLVGGWLVGVISEPRPKRFRSFFPKYVPKIS